MLNHSLVHGNLTHSLPIGLENSDTQSIWQRIPIFKKLGTNVAVRRATFVMNSSTYSSVFLSFIYQQFHSHLPEELFFDDFKKFFRSNYKLINRKMSSTYKKFKEEGDEARIHKFLVDNIISKDDFESRFIISL